jgi:hypothetical protein
MAYLNSSKTTINYASHDNYEKSLRVSCKSQDNRITSKAMPLPPNQLEMIRLFKIVYD